MSSSSTTTFGRWNQRLAPLFVEFGGPHAGERLLDVGCGTGNLTLRPGGRTRGGRGGY
jgi:ubiquinone/menaquinone biosynthesis C-methylase UbiE